LSGLESFCGRRLPEGTPAAAGATRLDSRTCTSTRCHRHTARTPRCRPLTDPGCLVGFRDAVHEEQPSGDDDVHCRRGRDTPVHPAGQVLPFACLHPVELLLHHPAVLDQLGPHRYRALTGCSPTGVRDAEQLPGGQRPPYRSLAPGGWSPRGLWRPTTLARAAQAGPAWLPSQCAPRPDGGGRLPPRRSPLASPRVVGCRRGGTGRRGTPRTTRHRGPRRSCSGSTRRTWEAAR
jgi:hypothetical protein